jgi:predicted kinase
MAPLVIPDPSLVLLIGAAGSGKTTLAARLFAADDVMSSDALRAAVAGDEADQGASRVAFQILHRTLDRRMARGQLTVIDATNAFAAHRWPLIRRASAASLPVVAIVFDLDPQVVHAQNTGRARIVDMGVVDRHLAAIRATVDGDQLVAEGVASIVVLRSPEEAAALTIVREQAPLEEGLPPSSPPRR